MFLVGLFDEEPGRETFRSSLVKEHQFNVLGELHHKTYNPPYIKCGKGHQFTRFEDDPETVHEITRLGEKLSAL